jgi:hypothetical protein
MSLVHPTENWTLLSIGIAENREGYYPFYERSILNLSEPIRREIIRGERAVKNFNPLEQKWQVEYINQWVTNYFVPFILMFQRSFDEFLRPFYSKGADAFDYPETLRSPDQFIYDSCDNLLRIVASIAKFTQENTKQHSEKIKAYVFELKTLFPQLSRRLDFFYTHMEKAQSQANRSRGEKEYYKIEQRIGRYFLTHYRTLSSTVIAAMYHGWSIDFKGYDRPPNCIEESPWCNERTREEAMAGIPYLFSDHLVSAWNDRYQRLKAMINCVYKGEDTMAEWMSLHGKGLCRCVVT